MLPVDPSWVFDLMKKQEPHAPWYATFESSAETIAIEAAEDPLFSGEDGAQKTAALLVGLGDMEGALKPDAKGDCPEKDEKGMCKPGSEPRSFCMFQIDKSNFAMLGTTKDEIQSNFGVCTRAALRILHMSFKTCARRPLEHRLDFYATGDGSCADAPQDKGVHRMRLAHAIFRKTPPPANHALDSGHDR